MLYGIISDIHGNLEAGIVVKEFLQRKGVEKILILGDIIGYGVNPEECIDVFDSMDVVFVKGNHEEAIITGDFDIFTTDAKISIEWTDKHFSSIYREKISEWKEVVEIDNLVLCHGGLIEPLYFYTNTRLKAKKTFEQFKFRYCFIGHTHFPMAFCISEGQDMPSIIAQEPDGSLHIILEEDKRYIINTGSVGQPRDGNPNACCGLFDSEKNIFELHRLRYPVEITAKKILDAGLPSSLASRISRGI
ncbi:MAG: metallophosphoesterase [Candidatus Omnitrophica bacterium]|nr:metallophosphoesterase [Candidatus Omnitrophota bacterium]MCM8816181.1 metallophosphoesterase [Candidatus Omnitrophota bacterium]